MEQTSSRNKWKGVVIAALALALLALLVWLFLRPAAPGRRIVFGDLGRSALPTNPVAGGPVQGMPEPPINTLSNGSQFNTNIAQTSQPGRELTDQNARRMEPPPAGQGAPPADASSNSAVAGSSSNEPPLNGGSSSSAVMSSNQTTIPPSNSAALPPPKPSRLAASSSSTRGARGAWTPDGDAWPDSPNKDSTAKLLADAKAANMSRINPIPARTADLLGHDSEPWRVFDAEIGSNVVFLLDNSTSMMTNGKSSSARQEVARTLQAMNAGKLFYVLFFHSGGYEGMPSLAPLPASPENVQSVTNWLFSVGHRTGADPTKAMQRSLGLVPAPDTVWLLSGSPLAEDVVDNVRRANASVNAHINTIGFYSHDGDQALHRIADENRGAYRFVPPPNASSPP